MEFVTKGNGTLINANCFDVMKTIPTGYIDCVIVDPPFGVTKNEWDKPLDFTLLWEHYNRIVKPEGAILIFGIEPFSSQLRLSNIKNYKYDWIWKKSRAVGHLNAWKMPMRNTENISVFYRKPCIYNPQLGDKDPKNIRPYSFRTNSSNYGEMAGTERKCPNNKQMPATIIEFDNPINVEHPTQKPLGLIEYLVKTYSNEGDMILDNCLGSGTLGLACENLNRKWIGIEQSPEYYNLAKERIWTDKK